MCVRESQTHFGQPLSAAICALCQCICIIFDTALGKMALLVANLRLWDLSFAEATRHMLNAKAFNLRIWLKQNCTSIAQVCIILILSCTLDGHGVCKWHSLRKCSHSILQLMLPVNGEERSEGGEGVTLIEEKLPTNLQTTICC